MKKPYSLDYSITRDIDRVHAVNDILDSLDTDLPPSDLEQLGSYILYGKDENGLNAVQRGEMLGGDRRFSSWKTKDDKLKSLDELLENPLVNETQFNPTNKRDIYNKKLTQIRRPRYNSDGTLKDIGDGDIPGMQDWWDSIDRLERRIAVAEGRIPPAENSAKPELSSYVLWQLKHTLIDLRRHQYYLRDSYKPTIHFLAIDHPKQQFINWAEDAAYWIPLSQWQSKVSNQLIPKWSTNLDDYETRTNAATGELEVHWIVQRHTFNWEDPWHIRMLLSQYSQLYEYFKNKLDTYGRTLIFDFERYVELTNFSSVRKTILKLKMQGAQVDEIRAKLIQEYGFDYEDNHLYSIMSQEIPKKIAETVRKINLELDTPEYKKKRCHRCRRFLPRDPLFFGHNKGRRDGWASNCKECEKKRRIEKKEVSEFDRRKKDSQVFEMQKGEK